MSDRGMTEQVIRELHEARVRGDLAAMCALFADRGVFRISGASDGKPISVSAEDLASFKTWLSMMVKVFRVTNYERVTQIIEGPRGAVLWRADIRSRITGVSVATELVDLVEVSDGRIVRYNELFTPR